jgi:MazG family protein
LDDIDGGSEPLHMENERVSDAALARALALVRYLRLHCPWDARQDARSLRPYLLEEAHETAEAIMAGDDDGLRAELGDLLLNVAFQIVLGEERGSFGAEDVVHALEKKMRDRHPHVYGDAEHPPDWERLKAEERRRRGDDADAFAGLPAGLEPLDRAMRVQERAAGLNFDWPNVGGALDKIREEIAELERELEVTRDGAGEPARRERIEDEAGDLLFAAVNVARLAGVHASLALTTANAKFERRFARLLEMAGQEGLDVHSARLDELEALWQRAKT